MRSLGLDAKALAVFGDEGLVLLGSGRLRPLLGAVGRLPARDRRHQLPDGQFVHLARAQADGGADPIEVLEVEGLGGIAGLSPACNSPGGAS